MADVGIPGLSNLMVDQMDGDAEMQNPPDDDELNGVEEADPLTNGALGEQLEPVVEGEGDEEVEEEEEEDDEDDFVVTIGDIKATGHYAQKQAVGQAAGKLDMDQTPTLNGMPIYDMDLAQMEDKPWRKPGADITDYFNYGFTEETWNMYCERQRKLRAEYSNQGQGVINRALFNSITMVNPISSLATNVGGRQLQSVPIVGGSNVSASVEQKFVVNLSNPPPSTESTPQQTIIRTVLTGVSQQRSSSIPGTPQLVPTIGAEIVGAPTGGFGGPSDYSKPPPVMDNMMGGGHTGMPSTGDGPPGVDEPGPPGSTPPPGVSFAEHGARQIPTLDTSIPPPMFNPLLPPPGVNVNMMRMGGMGMPPGGMNIPPPVFGGMAIPPPAFRYGAGGGGQTGGGGGGGRMMMGRAGFGPSGSSHDERGGSPHSDRESDGDDDYRRRRYGGRRRSRSRSPRRSRDDRDTDRYRRSGGESSETRSGSRRHRSRSNSPHESSATRSSRRREDKDKEKEKEKKRERSPKKEDDKDRKKRKHGKSDDEPVKEKEKKRRKEES